MFIASFYRIMSFILDWSLYVFLGRRIGKKQSCHRIKSFEASVNTRVWNPDDELKQPNCYTVINRSGEHECGEDVEDGVYKYFKESHESCNDVQLLQEEIFKLKEERDYWKNVVIDKENEIEQLLCQCCFSTEKTNGAMEAQLYTIAIDDMNGSISRNTLHQNNTNLEKIINEQETQEFSKICFDQEDDTTKMDVAKIEELKVKTCELENALNNPEFNDKLNKNLKNQKDKLSSFVCGNSSGVNNKMLIDTENNTACDNPSPREILKEAERQIKHLKLDKDTDLKLIQYLKATTDQSLSIGNEIMNLSEENDNLKDELENMRRQIEDNQTSSTLSSRSMSEIEKLVCLNEKNKALNENIANNEAIVQILENELNTAKYTNLKLKKGIESAQQQQTSLPYSDDTEIEITQPDAEITIQYLKFDKIKDFELKQDLTIATVPLETSIIAINKPNNENIINELHQLQIENNKLKDTVRKYENGFKEEIGDIRYQVEKLEDKLSTKINQKCKGSKTSKLKNILQKAIHNGLKSLPMDELEYLRDTVNKMMAQKKGKVISFINIKSSEILQISSNAQEYRIVMLLQRLEAYRQHIGKLDNTLMKYSIEVQNLMTLVGLLQMKVQCLEHKLTRNRLNL